MPATARAGEEIELSTDAGGLGAYRAVPASGLGPGVVVIQEWWGLVDHIRDVCDRLAREGFVALAPDLYRGGATGDPGEAGRRMMDLQIAGAGVDLDAAVMALLDHHAVLGARVGVVGFCMGGQLALYAAGRNERIGAVVDCYGIHPRVAVEPSRIRAAVLGVFAEQDEYISHETVRALEADLQTAGVRARFTIHPGVGHAFMNDSRPEAYDGVVASAAWTELLNFLRAELV